MIKDVETMTLEELQEEVRRLRNEALAGPEFMQRLKTVSQSIEPWTPEAMAAIQEGPEVSGTNPELPDLDTCCKNFKAAFDPLTSTEVTELLEHHLKNTG